MIKNIAFIGTGKMGKLMATNLMKGGYALTVYSRTRQKAEELLTQGARWADSAGEAAKDADCIITMVGGPQDVEQIYFREILDQAKKDALLIDMTSSSPKLSEKIHAAAKTRGACMLDAPVTGGPPAAAAGTLTIMVGGDKADFDRAQPVLSKMGSTLLYFGTAGAGQRAKLVNQVVAMQNIIAAIEGLFLSRAAGLDGDAVLQMLQAGTADSKSLRAAATKAFKGDFSPSFSPQHVVKDLALAIDEAESLSLNLPGLKNALARWQELVTRFPDTHAVQEVARLYM